MTKQIDIAILTNVIPVYREGFYNKLFANSRYNVKIYCQDKVPGVNYKTIHEKYKDNLTEVKFWALPGGKLTWQFLPYYAIFKNFDLVFIDGNPRILSQAIFATILRFLNKKVILWSMVHSFRNNKFFEKIRISWMRIFKYHFVYNDNDVNSLIKYGFSNKIIIGMNNGLDQEEIDKICLNWTERKLIEWRETNNISEFELILSSGRLENDKYIEFTKLLPKIVHIKPNIKWVIIGDGPDLKNMKSISEDLNMNQNIIFLGEIYNNYELAPWFLSSKFLIQPCAMGLSLLHAFGFGLPVITHNNANEHGPEFSAFENGKTGLTYNKKDFKDLETKIVTLLANESLVINMKKATQKIAREKYNTNIMYNNFNQIVEKILKN